MGECVYALIALFPTDMHERRQGIYRPGIRNQWGPEGIEGQSPNLE